MFGQLDTAQQCISRVQDKVITDWKSGEKRMRIEDVERVRNYCKSVSKFIKDIQCGMDNFETIAPPKEKHDTK